MREEMDPVRFFDCNGEIGRRQIKQPCSFDQVEDFLRKMEHYGIDRAIVRHAMSVGYNAAVGNRLLMEEIKPYPSLEEMWMVLPHHTGEFPAPGALQEELKQNGIRAVTMMPREYMFSTEDWCCGELFSMLEETRVPLLISPYQISWDELHKALCAHPGLRVILTDLHYNSARKLYPLLEKFAHLHAEVIGFKVFGGIEDLCQRFGAERLVFGTCAPLYSGGAAVGMVMYARISRAEKRLIAGENLERLLKDVRL